MFKRSKTKKGDLTQAIETVNPIDLIRKQFLYQLQQLSALTKNDFQLLYADTVRNFENYFAGQSFLEKQKTLSDIFSNVVLALKKRRGYLLPVGADSETSFLEREEWTFAVFSSALLSKIDSKEKLKVADSVLGKSAFAWLRRNNNLFTLWQNYLNGEDNIFSEIVEINDGLFLFDDKESVSADCEIKADSLTAIEAAFSVDDKEKLLVKKTVKYFTCDENGFWNWIEKTLESKVTAINQPDSAIHRVELGMLLVMPNIIDEFLQYQFNESAINESTFNLRQRITLTKSIKKNALLLRNEKGSRIHAYCFEKWEERRVISGLIINPKTLFGNDFIEIPVNSKLSIDPLSV